MARLVSVNVGLPREISWRGQTVYTSVWKEPIQGRRLVRLLNIDGDAQGDLAGHGGEQRAVFVYQMDSYRYWERELQRSNFTFGQFGENFTVEGLADSEVCIGDRYRIGGALFEVTQPRVTCYRVGIRMDDPRMPSLLVKHRRPGFYFRVIEEGEVGAGDEIIQVAEGPEHLTVASVDALLYLPGAAKEDIERALRIPALSPGWQSSFEAMLQQMAQPGSRTGNAGLVAPEQMATATPGFRSLKVARIDRESSHVVSLVLEPTDDRPLTVPQAGQFVVLRLRPQADAPPVLRSYSLSGLPDAGHYRISVKQEPHGVASTYVSTQLRTGDVLDVSEPRGAFTLRSGDRPVVLLSVGVGVTPVLAMLHALVAQASVRPVWWIFGARNGGEHPFAQETHELLAKLPNAHSHVQYSQPDPTDQSGSDFDATGRLTVNVLEALGVPLESDFYLCGPSPFLADFTAGLVDRGVAPDRIHTEAFGSGKSITPGVTGASHRAPHAPTGPVGEGPSISFARTGLTVAWGSRFQSLLELAEACDVPVRWSCRTGVCHMCESGLISGSVNYDPEPLDAPAVGNLLICCARPQEDTVIDL
ncbi:MOSC domain-containing protein [Leptolyngbya sp. FACHB-321]|uniref:MOSC and FAD-binding oxidoreductase domain-containing protein n=1 Tax=Leptolyngbya sp. FACHB-321 TaxID=2692807 RepID=UPI0016864F41|nr:MOSC and FAD-binding oxidoreductase domain-containing protein [Leptolyngbya sp. FACHB-321]MBD2033529.1 MOSC domain-containing protein [Leptolyngbya sp. FACHB-321]